MPGLGGRVRIGRSLGHRGRERARSAAGGVPRRGRRDVRDVPPHRTSAHGRGRHEGKTDRLDSHQVAIETQTNPRLAPAFKQAASLPPGAIRVQIALWQNARASLTKIRVQLLGELDALVHDLPEALRDQLRPAKSVRARVNALSRLDASIVMDPMMALRLRLIEHPVAMLRDVLKQDRATTAELARYVSRNTGRRFADRMRFSPLRHGTVAR